MMMLGAVIASGSIEEVVTREIIREVYGLDSGLDCHLLSDPRTGRPTVVPRDWRLLWREGQNGSGKKGLCLTSHCLPAALDGAASGGPRAGIWAREAFW